MLDVESWGGQISGNQSGGINAAFDAVADWLGDRRRVVGYGNQGDLDSLWPSKPADARLVVAKYSTTRPDYPGQVAHQYTDGSGFGTGPQSSPPFGNCDHNYAYGLTPQQFAATLGIGEVVPEIDYTTLGYEQLAGPRGADGYGHGWPQLGQNAAGQDLTFVDALAVVKNLVEGKPANLSAPTSAKPAAAVVPDLPSTAAVPRGELILPYDHNIVPQETGYWCGPAATQVCLNGQGVFVSEQELANDMGTDTGGTDYIGLLEGELDKFVPDRQYVSVYTEQDPMSGDQKAALWQHLCDSIYGGCGVPMNWVAPPGNKPIAIKGSTTPSYSGGTTYHYVCAMGIDETYPGGAVWIADSGFQPFNYWISFDQCATLIPPKGYTYATSPINTPPAPAPDGDKDYERLEYEQMAGPVGTDGYGHGWPQLGGLSITDTLAAIKTTLEGGSPNPPEPPPDGGGGEPTDRHALLTCSGTWAAPGVGYPSMVAAGCAEICEEIPVQAPWSFGPIPPGSFTAPSYQESIDIGVNWAVDWLLAHPHRTFLLGGYSQGGECASRIYKEMLPGGRLESVATNFCGGFTFGNPCRQAGHSFHAGPDRPWRGIASWNQFEMGDWWADECEQCDMYPCVPTTLAGEIMTDVYTLCIELQLHSPAEMIRDLIANCLAIIGNLDGDAFDSVQRMAGQKLGRSFLDGAHLFPAERLAPIIDKIRSAPEDPADVDALAQQFGIGLGGPISNLVDRFVSASGPLGILSIHGIAAAIYAAVIAIGFVATSPPTACHIQYESRTWNGTQTYLDHAIQHVRHWAATRQPTQ